MSCRNGLARVAPAFAVAVLWLVFSSCAPDDSSPTAPSDVATAPADLPSSASDQPALPPGVPPGAKGPPDAQPLGNVAMVLAELAPGQCVLEYRRGPFGYTPFDFELVNRDVVAESGPYTGVTIEAMRAGVLARRAICRISRTEEARDEAARQLIRRLGEPARPDPPQTADATDVLTSLLRGRRIDPADRWTGGWRSSGRAQRRSRRRTMQPLGLERRRRLALSNRRSHGHGGTRVRRGLRILGRS